MKEIDFLPEWYKNGRRRQISCRAQYVALGCIFVVMVVWSFVASALNSKATAELAQMAARQTESESVSREFDRIKSEVTELQKKAEVIEAIDSKIDVIGVLAEISFLIDEKIVLSKVELKAEKFADGQDRRTNNGSTVRIAGANFAGDKAMPFGDVKFKVVIGGVAADACDVAMLVCKLEDSPYFWLVYPSFSRSRKIKAGTAGEDLQVSEFEISCELANYQQKGPYFVNKLQSRKATEEVDF